VATFGLVLIILWMRFVQRELRPIRDNAIHHRRLLVHRIDVVRESCRYAGAVAVKYLRRDRAGGRSCVRDRAACRDAGGRRSCRLALTKDDRQGRVNRLIPMPIDDCFGR
jgi:hypothetical protein